MTELDQLRDQVTEMFNAIRIHDSNNEEHVEERVAIDYSSSDENPFEEEENPFLFNPVDTKPETSLAGEKRKLEDRDADRAGIFQRYANSQGYFSRNQ